MEEQEGDELPLVMEKRATRCQPRHEIRTERLEQCLNTLTGLVSMLVAALGQNAANVAPVIPPGIPLAKAKRGKLYLPKRAGTPRLARHRLRLVSIEGALGVDVETLPDQLTSIISTLQSPVRLNAPGTQSLINLNGQQSIQTWTMTTTLNSSTLPTQGEVWTYVLGLMLDAHSVNSKLNTSPNPSNT